MYMYIGSSDIAIPLMLASNFLELIYVMLRPIFMELINE